MAFFGIVLIRKTDLFVTELYSIFQKETTFPGNHFHSSLPCIGLSLCHIFYVYCMSKIWFYLLVLNGAKIYNRYSVNVEFAYTKTEGYFFCSTLKSDLNISKAH